MTAEHRGGQCTLRWHNKSTSIQSIESFGWEPGHIKLYRAFLARPSGICLVSGQTNSGKSTVLASGIAECIGTGRAINTIEDPVEIDLGVIQTSVKDSKGEEDNFFELSKRLLRHDVDIEMHGEIRDRKSAMSVCRKGETGQIMLSTLHTSSAQGILPVLNKQLEVPASLIASPKLMRLWIYQTLVRKLCPHCNLSLDDAKASLTRAQLTHLDAWMSRQSQFNMDGLRFKNPKGCPHCYEAHQHSVTGVNHLLVGQKGLTAVVEMIHLDDEDRRFILQHDWQGWSNALVAKGFKSVADHASLKIRRGEIDFFTAISRVDGLVETQTEEVYRSLWEEDDEQNIEESPSGAAIGNDTQAE